MNVIAFTRVALPYGWLGNMSPYPIWHLGYRWRTTEHLFQALRFRLSDPLRMAIRDETSPMGAKFLAKKHADAMIVEQGSPEDLDNMRLVLRLKVDQYPELLKQLLETGDAKIVEDVTNRTRPGNHDFWGARLVDGKWVGLNWLGRLWEEVRDERNSPGRSSR